jgi:precorrin-3B C17-methyltransferase
VVRHTPPVGHLTIVGLGPGSRDLLPPRALHALAESDMVIGYQGYIAQICDLVAGKEVHVSELTHEVERAALAVARAWAGQRVCVVSSGDAGIYGMAGLVLDLLTRSPEKAIPAYRAAMQPEVEIVPGISALNAAASLLGAPLMHDFAVISLSDRLTPWQVIRYRLSAVAAADFVVVLYNPASRKRTWQLGEAQRLLLEHRPATTPVGIVRNAYRPGQQVQITTLEHLCEHEVDMFTTVVIGNSRTLICAGWMITSRGYEVPGS